MSQYCTLGPIEFEVLTGPTAQDAKYAVNYADQPLIGRKGLLQRTGFSPDEINWTIQLHAGFCNPGDVLREIKEQMDLGAVLSLVMASGEYRGTFVIKDMAVNTTHTDPVGNLIAVEAQLSLAEYVGDPANPNPPGVIGSGVQMDASGLPPLLDAVTTPPAGLFAQLDAALAVVGQVGQAAGQINAIGQAVASGDVLQATALAGAAAPALAEMAAQIPVEELQGLAEFVPLAADAGAAATQLITTRSELTQAASLLSGGNPLGGLSSASGHVQGALNSAAAAQPSLDRLEAYVTVGSRLAGLGGVL